MPAKIARPAGGHRELRVLPPIPVDFEKVMGSQRVARESQLKSEKLYNPTITCRLCDAV